MKFTVLYEDEAHVVTVLARAVTRHAALEAARAVHTGTAYIVEEA